MTKLLALFLTSLIVSPVIAYRDILDVCRQTPGMTLFGQFLEDNPDTYAVYAPLRNATLYIPSDQALLDNYAKTGVLLRRSVSSAINAAMMCSPGPKPLRKRGIGNSAVQETLNNKTSPNGDYSVIIVSTNPPQSAVQKRQAPTIPPPVSPGISFATGGGAPSHIIYGDMECLQGIIQVVDTVFKVPVSVRETLTGGGYTKFLKAINSANLGDKYDNKDKITVFAPIDSAFDNWKHPDVASHVVYDQRAYSPYFEDGAVYTTTSGGKLYVSISNGEYLINCVRVVQLDALTNNGVVHGVEQILQPAWGSSRPVCK